MSSHRSDGWVALYKFATEGHPSHAEAALLYLELGLKATSKRTKLAPRSSIRREVHGWLITARPGHGHFAAYYQRFPHKEEVDWWCPCGNYCTPPYPFGCTNARVHSAILWSENQRQAHCCTRRNECLCPDRSCAWLLRWMFLTNFLSRKEPKSLITR